MNLRLASISLAAFVALTGTAKAQDLDFSKISCKEFLASSMSDMGVIITWLEGYYTKKDAPPIMYREKGVRDLKALFQYCKAYGNDNIIQAANAVMPAK